MMKNTVLSFMSKHQLIKKNSTILVGVSGGPDSMALLHFLRSISSEWHFKIIVVSVDHQLRGKEAREDLCYVQEQCEKWGIPFIGAARDVPSYKRKRQIGTQLAAREMRYRFFAEQMDKQQADYLALGHHGDDQVETMLMHLVRTASSTSFSGIPVKRKFASGEIIRPFLCVTKSDINTYCQEKRISPRLDPSNEETDYTRNYFRKNLLPVLKSKNNNLHQTVQRLSETLQTDEAFLQREAADMVDEVVKFDNNGKVVSLEINQFKSHALALQRRAYHLILNYLYDKLPENLSYVHEADFFALLEVNRGNVQIDFPCNLKLEKSYQKIRFYFQSRDARQPVHEETLHVPGQISLENDSIITAVYTDVIPEEDEHTYICPAEGVSIPLHIRTYRAGDRMSWRGLQGSKKIKDIFIDAKIPRYERGTWPLVTDDNGDVLWLIGLKKGQTESQAEKSSSSYIQLNYKRGSV